MEDNTKTTSTSKKLSKEAMYAKSQVDEIYKSLIPLVDEVIKKHSRPLDEIVYKIKHDIENLSNKEISSLMIQLGVETYYFGQKKDYASLKQACAEAILKENFAKAYISNTGTAVQRQNQSLLDTINNTAIKLLYDVTSNLMKTKLDEAHRLINILNGVLINRNAEAKLKPSNYDNNDNSTQNEFI